MGQKRHTLLIVDDEPDVLDSLRHQFHRSYRVLTRTSGVEAVETLANDEVDLILSDQRMPGMTGDQLLKRTRAQARGDPDALHRIRRYPGCYQRGE